MSNENNDELEFSFEEVIQFIFGIVQCIFEKVIAPLLRPLAKLLHINEKYVALIITCITTILFIGIAKFVPQKENIEIELKETIQQNTDIEYSALLPGIYSVSIYYENSKQSSKTAEIKLYNNEYRLIMVGEYSPEYIKIIIDDKGSLISDKIGIGTLSYKKEIDKTTIIFTQNKYIWKLIK